jgi:serine/threonine protein kinase
VTTNPDDSISARRRGQFSEAPLTPDDVEHTADEREARVLDAVRQYESELKAGRRPNRREILARHPDIADDISACLAGLTFVHGAAVEMNPPATPGPSAPPPPPAEPLGDFRLVREIGRGGMGVVYEAVQLSLGRRVAVKVLPLAAALDARQIERFRNEAQAAARLHHTNIVPVHAVGCERSVHFYAMQLIDGQSLADVIRQLRDLAGSQPAPRSRVGRRSSAVGASPVGLEPTVVVRGTTPERSPTEVMPGSASADTPLPNSATELSALHATNRTAYARSVATLGAQIADALEHAHRAGIVHRDVKPANLLLDRAGTIWVTDFGLAQFYADGELTRSADMVGTMRYMSPEQASGRAVVLDQRTDVYSLGATLYELLTLRPAVQGSTHEELLRRIAVEDPPPARSIDRTVPVEVEVILAKAMCKDPADRYQSARAFADDLRRFLNHEPIVARPPTLLNQATKWVRRHKALSASSAVVVTLAAIGFSVSTALIAHQQSLTKDALRSEKLKAIEARQHRAHAEQAAREARAAIDFIAGVAATLDQPRDVSEARRVMLEEALNYYEQYLDAAPLNPNAAGSLADAHARVARLLDQSYAADAAGRAAARVSMLASPAVQADLGMTPAEIAAIPKLKNDDDDQWLPGGGGSGPPHGPPSPDARHRDAVARAAAFDAELGRLLGPDRFERLRQIQRQVRGAVAFGDPDLVRRLGLTRDQRAKIREIAANCRAGYAPGGGGGGPGRPPGTQRADETVQILAVFTPAQRETWQALLGPTFTGHLLPPDARGPGQRPGGPPQPPGRDSRPPPDFPPDH